MSAITSHDCLLKHLCIHAQIKENSKAPRYWTLWGEFTGDRRIPHTKGQLEDVIMWLNIPCYDRCYSDPIIEVMIFINPHEKESDILNRAMS